MIILTYFGERIGTFVDRQNLPRYVIFTVNRWLTFLCCFNAKVVDLSNYFDVYNL